MLQLIPDCLNARRATPTRRLAIGAVLIIGSLCLIPGPGVSAAETSRTEVLVYYANETSPDTEEARNFATFTNWLESSPLQQAQDAARSLRQDVELFPQAVDAEVTAIRTHVLSHRDQPPVLVFTNRLAREGHCLVCDPRIEHEFRELPMKRWASDHFIIASNPLSQGAMLWQALEIAAATFAPERHTFVLVTKSHGGPQLALTVKLARRASEVSREQVLQHLESGTSDSPAAVIGTSKEEYIEILRRAGQDLQMDFPLVFMESCLGTFSEIQAAQLPSNVSVLFSSGQRFLEYRTLDYSTLLAQTVDSNKLSAALGQFLKPRYLSISKVRATSFDGWSWIWFAPLLVWLGWTMKGRRAGQPESSMTSLSRPSVVRHTVRE